MKRLFAVLLAAAVLFSAAACSTDSDPTRNSGDNSDNNASVTDKENIFPLDMINYYIDDDGDYRFNNDDWQILDDYDLFREYFFGSWESNFGLVMSKYPFYVIDDSEKSFTTTESYAFGSFYRVSEKILAYTLLDNFESLLFWLDIDAPDTMYQESFNGNYLFGYDLDTYKMGVFTKTDAWPNEAEENFLSVFRLREISKQYGIDHDLLTKIECPSEKGGGKLFHDNHAQAYPIYLVSEAPDRLVLKTTLWNVYETDYNEADVTYTLEKNGEDWVRTEEISYRHKNLTIMPYGLLNAYTDDDGMIQVDTSGWKLLNDYELFRKYFFGSWEGRFVDNFFGVEQLIIDDSELSVFVTNPNMWYSGLFYEVSDHVLAFVIGDVAGPTTCWLDTEQPDTMYLMGGSPNENMFGFIYGGTNGYPTVFAMKKTDAEPNEAENGFLSLYLLYEMSEKHNIDFDMLVTINYPEAPLTFSHDAYANSYPVYLVSESPDKIVLREIVWNYYYEPEEALEALCTFEKINGEWTRTIEFI